MPRGGRRPNSGRKSWKHEFNAACMLGRSAGILEHLLNSENIDLSEEEKERRKVALEVFKKLAPSNIKLDGDISSSVGIRLILPDKKKVDLSGDNT